VGKGAPRRAYAHADTARVNSEALPVNFLFFTGRSESMMNRISRFVFALPTHERLQAVSSPQIVPTFSEQKTPVSADEVIE
jgi:hypothetical protein